MLSRWPALLVALPLSVLASASDLVAVLDSLRTMHAHFLQIENVSGQLEKKVQKGEVWIKAPGRFRWHVKGEEEQLIVADGMRLWVYDVALQQVGAYLQKDALRGSPAGIFSNPGKTHDVFAVQEIRSDDNRHRYRLEPRNGNFIFDEIQIELVDQRISNIVVLRYEDNSTISIRLKYKSYNQPLDRELFHFSPPIGVDVIE